MSIKESALSAITSIAQSDFIRAVTSAGASRRITVANLAKAIIENYTGSNIAGSAQSVKSALDSLNSKLLPPGIILSPSTSGDNQCKLILDYIYDTYGIGAYVGSIAVSGIGRFSISGGFYSASQGTFVIATGNVLFIANMTSAKSYSIYRTVLTQV